MVFPPALWRCCLLFCAMLRVASASVPDPRDVGASLRDNPNLATADGELFCWHASNRAESLLNGYEVTGDARWLEEAQGYYDFLLTRLTRDPDGREGWIGRSIWHAPGKRDLSAWRTDAVVGDAILLAPLVRFAEIVKDDPALASRFGAAADRYVEKARKIGWEKWNARGTYYRDASGYGSYRMPDQMIDVQSGRWVRSPVPVQSENLNKHSAMAIVMLRLWRVTGEPMFRDRASEIFSRLKALFRYYPEEDRVVWNFWMPHGSYDLADGKLRSWVGVHPSRPAYQAEEVARMVEAYDSGVVFDDADLRRLIRTNHFMMPATPGGKWRSADGSSESGKLWSSLARFDPAIRATWREALTASDKSNDRLDLAYDDAVTAKHLSWTRRLVKHGVAISAFDRAPQPGVALAATVLIPDRLDLAATDSRVSLVTQTKAAGELVIELLEGNGRRVLSELWRQTVPAVATISLPQWDGQLPREGRRAEPGRYLVRWRLNGEIRTEKLLLTAPATELAPGLETGERAARVVVATASDHQAPYMPANAADGDPVTRWTAPNHAWLQLDLGARQEVTGVDVTIGQGDKRSAFFRLEISVDGETWTPVFEGASSGKTAGFERLRFPPAPARWVRYVGYGNSTNEWNNLNEVRVLVKATEAQP